MEFLIGFLLLERLCPDESAGMIAELPKNFSIGGP
jgi:hypothetical protein